MELLLIVRSRCRGCWSRVPCSEWFRPLLPCWGGGDASKEALPIATDVACCCCGWFSMLCTYWERALWTGLLKGLWTASVEEAMLQQCCCCCCCCRCWCCCWEREATPMAKRYSTSASNILLRPSSASGLNSDMSNSTTCSPGTNKQTSKQANKQTSKQANKQMNK